MDNAFEYIKENGGIETEGDYPYKAKDNKCHYDKTKIAATCTGFVDIPTGDEEALKEAVATIGPVSIAIGKYILYSILIYFINFSF
jgi:cathepsin L